MLKECETLAKVLELIRKEREEFGTVYTVAPSGAIRTEDDWFCPLCKIANRYLGTEYKYESRFLNREHLSWSQDFLDSITGAADDVSDKNRKLMEEACGLQ